MRKTKFARQTDMGIKEWFIKRAIEEKIRKIKEENPKMIEWLKGKKAYIVMGLTWVYAWGGYLTGLHDINAAVTMTLGGAGLGAVRGAIGKIEPK